MTTTSVRTAFEQETDIGRITIEPLQLDRDLSDLYAWVTDPKSRFWGLRTADEERVRAEYTQICASDHHRAWLGRVEGKPAFLTESYQPARTELADHYPVQTGDIGMHLLVAPTDRPRHGTTDAVLQTVMLFLFSVPRHDRVVVEPDVDNARIAAKNAAAGFVVERTIRLSDKRAALSFCTRTQFAHSRLGQEAIR
jgi:RimJ/RimL family protein N-acetyltransferase